MAGLRHIYVFDLSQFDDFRRQSDGGCSPGPTATIITLSAILVYKSRVFLLHEIKTTTASSSLISGVATYPDEVFYPVGRMSFFSRFCLSRDRD
jgi:hypothetical protein